ncbi:hypothetical protein [Rossellomorea vietnamensis]|uniref:hypothetical protein n=1 Tax=Rossellomorea vietnamensis TaxID=218284 RepID=UPI003CF1BE95
MAGISGKPSPYNGYYEHIFPGPVQTAARSGSVNLVFMEIDAASGGIRQHGIDICGNQCSQQSIFNCNYIHLDIEGVKVMKVNLVFNGMPVGAISFTSLPSVMLYLEENGYRSKWDSGSRTLEVEQFLFDKKVLLQVNTEDDQLAGDLGRQLKAFLKHMGIKTETVKEVEGGDKLDGDLLIRLVLSTEAQVKTNTVSISTTSGFDRRILKDKIIPLFKQQDHKCKHLHDAVKTSIPTANFKMEFADYDHEDLSLKLAMAAYHLLGKDLQKLNLFDLYWDLQGGTAKKAARERNNVKREEGKTAGQSVVEAVVERAEEEKQAQCDLFFDYSVTAGRKTEKYTVFSSIHLRNIGERALHNPVLCLKVEPVDSVDIGGQILPPGMSELFAVQGEAGAQGWEYIGEEWLEKAYTTGEYWIKPIQDLTIHPSESVLLEGVQFSFEPPEQAGEISIAGFVYFQDQNLQFKSLNTIVFSF